RSNRLPPTLPKPRVPSLKFKGPRRRSRLALECGLSAISFRLSGQKSGDPHDSPLWPTADRREPTAVSEVPQQCWTASGTTAPKRSARRLSSCGTLFACAGKHSRILEIDGEMASPGFWDNQEKAQERVAERKGLIGIVKPLDEALKASDDLAAMIEMAAEDESFAAEVPPEVERRSEEHTSELQSRENLVCRLLLEKKKKKTQR